MGSDSSKPMKINSIIQNGIKTKSIEDKDEFNELLSRIFDEESERLGISKEKYKTSRINKIYKPDDSIWDTHYWIFNPGPSFYRDIISTIDKKINKGYSNIFGGIFKDISFSLEEVLFRNPIEKVSGYGNFHKFFDIMNSYLIKYDFAIAYIRDYKDSDDANQFYDYVGLMKSISGLELKKTNRNIFNEDPIKEINEDKLFEINVKGCKLIFSSIASCEWYFDYLESEDDYDSSIKEKGIKTFHFLNRKSPKDMQNQLTKCLSRINQYLGHNK